MFGRNKWTNSSASVHYLDVEAALAGVSETGFLAELTGDVVLEELWDQVERGYVKL